MFRQFEALTESKSGAPAVIDGASGLVTTRAGLLARARELSSELSRVSVANGDVIAVQLPNSADFAAALLACLDLRLVFAPIDRDAPEIEVGAMLSHYGARALIYRHERTTISVRASHQRPPLPEAARMLKLTSGSTGMPKGIVCTEETLAADATNICSSMAISPSDINLGAIPFSHSYGFSNLVTPLILQGTAVVVSNDYIPASVITLCNRYSITVAPLIPMVFEHLAALPRDDGGFATVRTFISAGAPLLPSTSRRFRERFGRDIHTFYGCSEVGGITYDRAGAAVERGTVGSALDGVSLGVDSASRRLSVRGAAVSLGYAVDAHTFAPFDGVFVTDDLADVDPRGEIVLTGRASDLINTAGRKVNPREVEQILLQLDGVQQAKVYGEPAGARGEVVAAAIVTSPDVTREQVREFCRARLSSHKVPRIVKFVKAIPVDARGKVKKAELGALRS
jgi:long-chain acyl-CoA synthetase